MNLFKSSVLCGMVIVSFMTSCTDVDITMPNSFRLYALLRLAFASAAGLKTLNLAGKSNS